MQLFQITRRAQLSLWKSAATI